MFGFAQIFGQARVLTASFWISSSSGCAWTSARVSAESELRGCRRPALAANRPAATSTDLRGGAARRCRRASCGSRSASPGCAVYIRRCRSAASFSDYFWVRPRGQRRSAPALAAAALRSGSLRSPSLRSAPAKPPGERTPREFSYLPFSFSPCSLINGTKPVSEMLARRVLANTQT